MLIGKDSEQFSFFKLARLARANPVQYRAGGRQALVNGSTVTPAWTRTVMLEINALMSDSFISSGSADKHHHRQSGTGGASVTAPNQHASDCQSIYSSH